jgi:hypothetical protein
MRRIISKVKLAFRRQGRFRKVSELCSTEFEQPVKFVLIGWFSLQHVDANKITQLF